MAKKSKGADRLVVQNAAKTLFANIRFASVDDPIQSVVVTSSVPNEGKSTVAIELAAAMAQGGKHVLLVETDMRRRTLADTLNVRARAGLYAVLAEQSSLSQAICSTQRGFDFLDAEPHIPSPADILASKRFANLLGILSQSYDYVVFDTPPVGTFVDAAIISAIADGTVLVVRENFTRRDEVTNAFEQLNKADANVIGICMNQCETETSEYYYAYYNKDGKRVKTHDAGATVQSSTPTRARRSHAAPARAASPAVSASAGPTDDF